jgi:hypothetical protein
LDNFTHFLSQAKKMRKIQAKTVARLPEYDPIPAANWIIFNCQAPIGRDMTEYGFPGKTRITVANTLPDLPPPTPLIPTKYFIGNDKKYQLIKLFGIMSAVFAKYSIDFWLDSGSLLGFCRGGEIMDHDDDIDVAVLCDIGDTAKDFDAAGVLLRRSRLDTYYQVYFKYAQTYGIDPHIDIFRFVSAEGILVNEDSRFRSASELECNMQFVEEELFPLVPVKFHGCLAYIPRNSPKCINIPRWQTEIRARNCETVERLALRSEGQPMAEETVQYIKTRWLADVAKCACLVLRRLKHCAGGCVVLDIDETILQNASIAELEHALPLTAKMRAADIGHFLPGAKQISDWCAKHCVNIYLITGRTANTEHQTVENLSGFVYKKIYFRPLGTPTLVHKILARQSISEPIILTAGDQPSDYIGGNTGFIVKYPRLYYAE